VTWLWWLLGAVVLAAVLDRVALWAEARGWIYWRRRRASGGGAGAVLGEVLNLFQPTRQHVVEEQERQRLTIAQKEAGEPPFGVDLDTGTAVLPGDPTASGGGPGPAPDPPRDGGSARSDAAD
jgi:hypothetical protein